MKKHIFIILLTFTSQLYAFEFNNNSTTVFSDLLIWQLREGSADNWAQEIAASGTNQPINVLSVPFNWNAGLRVGAGRNYGNWDMVGSYTWFQTKGSSQASVSNGGIYSPFLGNFFVNNVNGAGFGPHYYDASVQWKLYFNIFDLELGHAFKIDELLLLRPFLGIKGGWINQNINSNWNNPTVATNFTSATEDLKNDFWGIGPSIGLDTTWPIYKINNAALKIFGNFSGALLWGHWHFKDQYANNIPTTVTVHLDTINGAASMTRALIGLEWSANLSRSNINIRLGYEAQVWFNQVQYYSLNMGRLNNLMSLQGGVLGFCFYF